MSDGKILEAISPVKGPLDVEVDAKKPKTFKKKDLRKELKKSGKKVDRRSAERIAKDDLIKRMFTPGPVSKYPGNPETDKYIMTIYETLTRVYRMMLKGKKYSPKALARMKKALILLMKVMKKDEGD
jgi:hypothetical protein